MSHATNVQAVIVFGLESCEPCQLLSLAIDRGKFAFTISYIKLTPPEFITVQRVLGCKGAPITLSFLTDGTALSSVGVGGTDVETVTFYWTTNVVGKGNIVGSSIKAFS